MSTLSELAQADAVLKAADKAWAEARSQASPGGPLRRLNIMISEGFDKPSSPDYSLYLAQKKLYDDAVSAEIIANAAYQAASLNYKKILDNLEPESEPPPTATAAQAVKDDAAKGPSAQPPPTTPTVAPVAAADTGTDAPVRKLEQTQATAGQYGNNVGIPLPDKTGAVGTIRRNPETGELHDSAGLYPPTAAGAGANDDSGAKTASEVNNTVANSTANRGAANNSIYKQIIPQANVLDNFQNYTYHASVYMMTPAQANALTLSDKKTVDGYYLLFQSGGAPVNVGGFAGASRAAPPVNSQVGLADAGRNPAFPNDFYIDSITIENFLSGSQKTAHATTNIKFTVVEPTGITLIDNLYAAVQDVMGASKTGPINYNSITYLLVIRFYGYDQDGNIVSGIGGAGNAAVIEKFIPFRLSKVDFSIQSKLVTYNFEGLPMGSGSNGVAYGTRRGTIPYDMQLTAVTLDQLLGSKTTFAQNDASAPAANPGAATTGNTPSTAAAPPTAEAAASVKKTLQQGLAAALNQYQQELVRNGTYQVADIYEIVLDPEIGKSQIVPPGTKVEQKQTSMGTTDKLQALDVQRLSVEQNAKTVPIVAGMQIVQVIELAVRNSNYMLEQQQIMFNTEDDQESRDKATGKPLTWYNITFATTQLDYDHNRNDHAFKITYTVKPYQIDNFSSRYFPVNRFRGLHKSYSYWYTGKNTAVLEYQETLNNLYNLTVSGNPQTPNLSDEQRRRLTSSMREIPFVSFASRSSENSQGSEARVYEGVANLAESLYDPVGLANCKVKIVGDPAWLAQGRPSTGVASADLLNLGFNPDGSINFETGQVLFEVVWQKPQDYDLNTGLADPYKNKSQQPQQSRVYTATKCTSEFRQGKFEQTLEGLLYIFVKTPNPTNKAATAPAPPAGVAQGSPAADGAAGPAADGAAGNGTSAARPQAKPPTSIPISYVSDADAAAQAVQAAKPGAPSTGFATNDGGAAFGNPNSSRWARNTRALPVPTAERLASVPGVAFTANTPGPKDQTTPADPPKPASLGDGRVVGIATLGSRSAALIASVAGSSAAPQDLAKDA